MKCIMRLKLKEIGRGQTKLAFVIQRTAFDFIQDPTENL